MLLSSEERQRFIEWLKQDAESNRLLISQMTAPHFAPVLAVKKRLIAAELILIQELSNVEEQTL